MTGRRLFRISVFLRRSALTAVAAVATVLPGCALHEPDIREATESQKDTAGRLLDARRERSLRDWQKRRIGGEPAIDYARLRTAWLLSGDLNVNIQKEQEPDTWTIRIAGRGGEFGSAAPVTRDGYFLTAAHCIDREPVTVVVPEGSSPRLVRRPARIVWNGAREEGHPDIAIIHAPVRVPAALPMAEAQTIRPGMRVFTSGFGGFHQVQSGGRVLPRERADPVSDWWSVIRHDAPLSAGDSGGPLIDERGRLLGINSKVDISLGRFLGRDILWYASAAAVHIDPQFVRAVIAKDRARRR